MSWSFENGQMVITRQGRQVATTQGTLLQFLTEEQEFTTTIVFPQINVTELYTWYYRVVPPGGGYGVNGFCRSVVGARPQEWKSDAVLGDAPAGADLFVGRARLVRTIAPTGTWIGQTLTPQIPEGVDIQLWGSMVIELGPGIARGLTVDVLDGELVARLEHTVGPAAGNFRTLGTVPAGSNQFGTVEGAQNIGISGAGLPVFWRDGSPWSRTFSQPFGSTSVDAAAARSVADSFRHSGSSKATMPAAPNYSSTYSLTVRGRFGRRS